MQHPGGCEGALPSARRVVASMDLVAPTECLPEFLATIAVRLGFGLERSALGTLLGVRIPRTQPLLTPRLNAINKALRQQLTWETLNVTSRKLIQDVTSCDRSLYEDALQRSSELTAQCKLSVSS